MPKVSYYRTFVMMFHSPAECQRGVASGPPCSTYPLLPKRCCRFRSKGAGSRANRAVGFLGAHYLGGVTANENEEDAARFLRESPCSETPNSLQGLLTAADAEERPQDTEDQRAAKLALVGPP